jgi:hypothetical protein
MAGKSVSSREQEEASARMGDMLRGAYPVEESSELMMPVTDDHALRQFEIQALRQITDNLRRLNDRSEEQGKVLHSIDARLIRIENNKLEPSVDLLKAEVAALKQDKDRRDGAAGLVNWFLKNWVALGSFVALLFVVLKSNGKLG